MRIVHWLIFTALLTVTAVVFRPVLENDFINFDDDQYVTDNRHVQQGFKRPEVVWAFTARDAANWHPLTWLSHLLDAQFYGLNPRGHHLTSLLLHLANTGLLFFVFSKMTGGLWASAFVAALFALHPLHVESVAWVAERKDVLSTFFALLTLWAYHHYTRRPGVGRYAAVAILFSLGLSAKPMVITLPLVLLLLDYWPLGRLSDAGGTRGSLRISTLAQRLLEKAPLLLLSAGSAAITLSVQKTGGAIQNEYFPLSLRTLNALTSYAHYLWKMIWPRNLAVFYPHPGSDLPWWLGAAAGLLLLAVSIAVVRAGRRLPFLLVGWLWYLVTLGPVIGLVQVGRQGMADRYTYLPLTGVFIMVAWGAPALLSGWRRRDRALALASLLILPALGVRAHHQAAAWHDSLTLFSQALRATRDNWLAEYNVGLLLAGRGDPAGAAAHYRSALRIRPDYAEAHINLGTILAAAGKFEEAGGHFREAIGRQPLMSRVGANTALVSLGNVLLELGRTDEAAGMYQEARRVDPRDAAPLYCLALLETRRSNLPGAETLYREALRMKPDYQEAANNLAILLVNLGRPGEAVGTLERLLELKPDFAQGHFNIATILSGQGKADQAIDHYRAALRVNPGNGEARLALERALRAVQGDRVRDEMPLKPEEGRPR